MQSVVMLMMAGIRKNKKQLLSQMIIIFFAALLFNLGLLIVFNFSAYFDSKATELNAAHVSIAFTERWYEEKYLQYLNSHENVTGTQADDILLMDASLKLPGGNITSLVFGLDYDNMGAMSRINLVGDSLPPDSNSVYVPYVLQLNSGLRLGSPFVIGVKENPNDESTEKLYEFTVAGFTEDIMLGVTNTEALGVYFPHEVYREFAGQLSGYFYGTLLSAQLDASTDSTDFLDTFISGAMDGENVSSWANSIDGVRSARTLTSSIMAVMMVAFAVIILLVSQIVIRFRITNTIEEDMRNYGAMKALGYTSVQIIASIVLQFTVTTVVICAGGIVFSYSVVSALSSLLASLSGLNWSQGFDVILSGVCLAATVFTTALTAFMSSIKLKRMLPINALRGGGAAKPSRRNILPLENAGLGLIPVLAMKTTYINIKQNLLIILILASVSFAVIFSVVLSYNASTDTFVKILVGQFADVSLMVNPKDDVYELTDSVREMDDVEEAVIFDNDSITLFFGEQIVAVLVMEDFADILNDQTYMGRNPEHPYEIVISGAMGEEWGKDIGDTITLSWQEREAEYIITGFCQSSNHEGRESMMTLDGIRLLMPDYKESFIGVMLSDGADVYEVIDEVKRRYGDKFADIYNNEEVLNVQLYPAIDMINVMGILIVIITVLVVIFNLFLVVGTLVTRRRQELGIQKALGFTTFQLMNQIAGSFVPVAVLGTGLGSAIGGLTMNTIIGLLFREIGIMKADFVTPVPIIVMVSVLLCLLTYGVSMAVAVRIKKISAYGLITE